MSATLAPFGLRPCYHPTGLDRVETYQIPSGYATTIYKNGPVYLVTATGTIAAGAVSGATGALLGSFQGCEYTDTTGKPVYSNFWPASTTVLSGTTVLAYVISDPQMVFEIQSDGSVAQTAIGKEFNFSATSGYTYGAGSSSTGLSTTAVNNTNAATTVQGVLRCIGFGLAPDNAVGDSYTVIRVQIAQSQYLNPQTSV